MRLPSRPKSLFVAAVGGWCLLILLAPLLLEKVPLASASIYLLFSPICHQLSERSFFLFGHQLPVCARCTGIYLGAFAGSFFSRRESPSKWVLMAALFPMALDGGTQLLFRESTNMIRLITGGIAGFVVIFYLYAGLFSSRQGSTALK